MSLPSLRQILDLVGKLDDSEEKDPARERFRSFLNTRITEISQLRTYLEECLNDSGEQSSRALQDLVNRLGEFLGFEVTYGRYQGIRGQVGFDGHWISPETQFHIISEVKSSEIYPIKTATLLGYIDRLISDQKIPNWEQALGLYVVGRTDQEIRQLESTIFYERRTHQLRIISMQALLSLAEIAHQCHLSHAQILSVIRPSTATIDPAINLMASLMKIQNFTAHESVKIFKNQRSEKKCDPQPTESDRINHNRRTPQEAYYLPILKALVTLGGSASPKEVLDALETSMQSILTAIDYQPLESDPKLIRWRNSAQWARNDLVKQGLLEKNSPRGVWQISLAGRQYLAAKIRESIPEV